MGDIRKIETDLGVTRDGVEAIRDRLVELSAHRELFPLDDFPAPPPDDDLTSFMYRLAQDADDRFALYAQASRGHVETPAHDHTTWAVVVGHSRPGTQPVLRAQRRRRRRRSRSTWCRPEPAWRCCPTICTRSTSTGRRSTSTATDWRWNGSTDVEYYSAASGEWKLFANVSGIREARSGLPC